MSNPYRPPPPPRFAPRATLVLVGGVALFFALSLLYSLPVLLQPVPEGAPADWLSEQVRAHLAGKTLLLFCLSLAAAALFSARVGRR